MIIILIPLALTIFAISIFGESLAYRVSSPKYKVLMEMNVKIPMRDGIKLATDIYRPDEKGTFPVILVRTPYGSETKKFSDQGKYFARRGYVFAVQDCRGKYDSEGEWYGKRNGAHDGYDTINWLANQKWSSGRVGMVGASYLGLVQWQVAPTQNPHLKALIPIVAPVTLGRDLEKYRRLAIYGVTNAALSELSWLVTTDGRVNQNVNAYDWDEIFHHLPLIELPKLLGRNIPFWKKALNLKRGIWEEYLQSAAEGKWIEKLEERQDYRTIYEKVQVPIFQISGWFDCASEHCFYNYRQIKLYSKSLIAKNNQWILIGPWPHAYNRSSKLGDVDFGPHSVIDLDSLILRWFDRWLKEIPNSVENEAPLKLFLMGKNEWREACDWPLPETKYTPFYLHSSGQANSLSGDGELSPEIPRNEPPDKYIYNPAEPTPAITSGENKAMAESGPVDIRFIEERDDVLVYTSSTLKEDVEVTGPISVVLYISTNALETEFIVRLIDVHPDGSSYPVYYTYANPINIRGFQPIDEGPGKEKILKGEFELPPTSNIFLRGHRIRIDICSAAFPLFRNLNTGGDSATETTFNVAHQTIYHDEKHPSHILLPIIPKK